MRKMSSKNQRVSGEVQRELSSIIRELKDPRIAVMTTVSDTYVAPDLKTCKVYISVLGDEETQRETMEGLMSARGFMRRELAHRLNLRYTPELTLIADHSIGRGVEMSKKIDDVIRQDEMRHVDDPEIEETDSEEMDS
ncbi:MAG: 30S ribosome-binding factor RbfA [Lachnospiraceae bacterium]|nr:30S ribosome-binding factor RbfA [Lachnospiraceae bacterium]